MKFPNIDALDAHIESIIKKTVRHYYTDWKNWDRPKYMEFKGSENYDDKKFIIIARTCGTWIVRVADIYKKDEATVRVEHYYTQLSDSCVYYEVDLTKLSIKRIRDVEKYLSALRKEAMKNEKRSA